MLSRTLLVTCFEPFGGSARNASLEAVSRLPDTIGPWRLEKRQLPVRWNDAGAQLEEFLRDLRPAALLCTGQAGPEPVARIERLGVNLAEGTDNAGCARHEEPLLPGGPDALFSTLPCAAMLRRLTAEGVSARFSFHAGLYLCNCVLYTALSLSRSAFPELRAGFLHLPSLPEDGSAGLFPPETAARAIGFCLEEIAASLDGAAAGG